MGFKKFADAEKYEPIKTKDLKDQEIQRKFLEKIESLQRSDDEEQS